MRSSGLHFLCFAFRSGSRPLSLAMRDSCSNMAPCSKALGRISHSSSPGTTSQRSAGSKPCKEPLASASAYPFPERGDHSTCAFRAAFFMKAAISMITADAGKLVVIRRFKAAPLPRLSVHVGTTRMAVRCWPVGGLWKSLSAIRTARASRVEITSDGLPPLEKTQRQSACCTS